jgi:hypothetical protein
MTSGQPGAAGGVDLATLRPSDALKAMTIRQLTQAEAFQQPGWVKRLLRHRRDDREAAEGEFVPPAALFRDMSATIAAVLLIAKANRRKPGTMSVRHSRSTERSAGNRLSTAPRDGPKAP